MTQSETAKNHRLNVSYVGGLGAGVVAASAVYAVISVLALVIIRPYRSIDSTVLSGIRTLPRETILGWVFHSAHQVPIEVSGEGVPASTHLALIEQTIWLPFYTVLPPVVLLGVGFLLASSRVTWGARSGFEAGASVALGYLPFVVASLILWTGTYTIDQGFGEEAAVTVSPDPVFAIPIAGLLYPVLFGGIGGILGDWWT